jgi:hypothetical protein
MTWRGLLLDLLRNSHERDEFALACLNPKLRKRTIVG